MKLWVLFLVASFVLGVLPPHILDKRRRNVLFVLLCVGSAGLMYSGRFSS